MDSIFTFLSDALTGNAALALVAAFVWGILSIILSPCHLTSIPLIVAYLAGNQSLTTAKAFITSLVFSFGILLSIGVIGGITVLLGRMAGDLGKWGNISLAVLLLLFGLVLMDIIPLPIGAMKPGGPKRRSLFGALLIGFVFGIALGPCTFAFLAPVLGVVFTMAETNPLYASSLILSFAAGHCLVLAVAGSSVVLVQKILDINNKANVLIWLRRGCGLLVVIAGFYLITTS